MSRPEASELAAQALATGGTIQLATLLAVLLPTGELRELAKRFGLSPKGFRVEKARVSALATLLAESKTVEVLDEVCGRLANALDSARTPPSADTDADADPEAALEPVVRHLEQQLGGLRDELTKARQSAARHRDGEAELARELEVERASSARTRAEVSGLRDRQRQAAPPRGASDDARRAHHLERELATLAEAEEELRRRAAEQTAQIRGLEHEIEELRERIPKHRRKRPPPPPPPPVADVFRVPHFAPAFYKSIESKDRRSVAQALQAVVLFCVEGPSYPGLEVKRLEGSPLWSLRAALKVRVYFALRDDGTVEIVKVADREEQHTTLRRLRDRRD